MTAQSDSAVLVDREGIPILLPRLKAQSFQIDFQFQREMPLSLVLKPHLGQLTTHDMAIPLEEWGSRNA